MLSCFSHVRLFATLWAVACQAPLSMGFSGQESWSGLPCPPRASSTLCVTAPGSKAQAMMRAVCSVLRAGCADPAVGAASSTLSSPPLPVVSISLAATSSTETYFICNLWLTAFNILWRDHKLVRPATFRLVKPSHFYSWFILRFICPSKR